MTKNQFLTSLRNGLKSLPQNEIEERVNFYGEMIDDYIDEGLLEEQAVSKIGSVEQIVAQTLFDFSSEPHYEIEFETQNEGESEEFQYKNQYVEQNKKQSDNTKQTKSEEKCKNKIEKQTKNSDKNSDFKVLKILLIVFGALIVVPVLISIVATIFSLYVSAWAIIISLWAVPVSLIGGAIGSLFVALDYLFGGNFITAIALFALCVVCVGLSIFAIVGCKALCKAFVILNKKLFVVIKKIFKKGGNK